MFNSQERLAAATVSYYQGILLEYFKARFGDHQPAIWAGIAMVRADLPKALAKRPAREPVSTVLARVAESSADEIVAGLEAQAA